MYFIFIVWFVNETPFLLDLVFSNYQFGFRLIALLTVYLYTHFYVYRDRTHDYSNNIFSFSILFVSNVVGTYITATSTTMSINKLHL